MTRYAKLLSLGLAALAFGLGVPAHAGEPDEPVELDEAEVFIEWNSTDGDFGIQFFWDGEDWDRMKVRMDGDRAVLDVKVRGNLRDQGLTEGFFESAEPTIDELPLEEFLERFPEGLYVFKGRTLEGDQLVGEAEFTHVLPAPPETLWPADDDEVDATMPLIVSFDAVTMDSEGQPLEPESYEVVLETEDEDELERIFSIILRGDTVAPMVTIPPEFLERDGEYKLEVIVKEESGNKTISETEFVTLP